MGSVKPTLKLDWCTHEAAKWACEKWHYSGTMPVGKTMKIGVWEMPTFIGAMVFSTGAAGVGQIGPSFGMDTTAVCELQRVALRSHAHPVSRMLSIAVSFVREACPSLRLVVSYADPNAEHHGGIYQACGWIYVGVSSPTPKWKHIPTGQFVHNRNVAPSGLVTRMGKTNRGYKKSECERIEQMPKHKYFLPLDDDMRVKLLPLSKPYPKRAGSAAGGTPGHQPGGGGSTPTPAL